MKALIITLIVVLVIAALGYYAFLNGRKLWRSVKAALGLAGELGTKVAEPFSNYPPLPAPEPLASPFERERRVAAWEDLQRVHAERSRLRRARVKRATGRWDRINVNREPYSRLHRATAKARWAQRKDMRAASKLASE